MIRRCLPMLAWSASVVLATQESGLRETDSARKVVLKEIVVTAQRREQREQSVPVALTALTETDLTVRQVDEVAELQFHAPSLQIMPAQGNASSATIGMRGQVSGDIIPTVDPAVGLFLDGIYIARVTGANMELIDIERVEIMRGPQGSTYGRNTIGGAINIVPNKPHGDFDGSVELRAGNYGLREITGILNTPLVVDTAMFRVTVQHAEHSGYARAVRLGKDLSDDDTNFLRAQFRLAPESGWDLDLALDYADTSTGNQWITLLDATYPATLVPAATGNPEDSLDNYIDPFARNTQSSHAGGFDNRVWGVSTVLTLPTMAGTLRAIAAARDLDLHIVNTDLDGTPYDLATQFLHEQRQSQQSIELQMFGGSDRRNWIMGAYFFDEHVAASTHSNSLYPLLPFASTGSSETQNDSGSVWFHVATELAPSVQVQAGARYVEDRRALISRPARIRDGQVTCTLGADVTDQPDLCQATFPARSFHYVPFDVSVDYAPSTSLLLYGKYSRGYRAGGYNSRRTSTFPLMTFEPEVLDAWEVGWKADLIDVVRINVAAFLAEYDEIQLPVVFPDPVRNAVVVNVNAGSAPIDGGEVEVLALLAGAKLRVAVGRTRGRYMRVDPDVIGVVEGSAFADVPEWTVSASLDLPFRIGSVGILAHADYGWRDHLYFGGEPLVPQDAYSVSNVLVTINPGSRLEWSLWCRNLENTRYLSRAISTGNGFVRALPAAPRTWGATFQWRFGADGSAH